MSDLGRWRKEYVADWSHVGYNALTDGEKLLVHFLRTGPPTNRIGLFKLSIASTAEDLGTTSDTLRKRLDRVCETFGWHYDASARVLYQPDHWHRNPPENVKVMRGALKDLAEIPDCSLLQAFANNIEALSDNPEKHENVSVSVRQTFLEGLTRRLGKGMRSQEQYQEFVSESGKQEPQNSATFPQVARPENAKDGSDEKRFVPIAKEALKFTNPAAPIQELIDTFYLIGSTKARSATREQATRAINEALAERRAIQ